MKTCPGQPEHPHHPHLIGHYYDGAGARHWKTELAAEYPQALCQAMAAAYARALRVEPQNKPPLVEVSIKGVVNPVNAPTKKLIKEKRSWGMRWRFEKPNEFSGEGPRARSHGQESQGQTRPDREEVPDEHRRNDRCFREGGGH